MLVFRGLIAFVMAIVGSTIFDQTMFGKDIDKQMANNIELQVKDLTAKRVHSIEKNIDALKAEQDSIEGVNNVLQADVDLNPFIIQTTAENKQEKILMPNGSLKTVSNPTVTKTQVPNPKFEQIKANKEQIASLIDKKQIWTEKKQTVEEDVRRECKENVGFLEELEAMASIITTRPLAGAFYLVFFVLLMSLGLFVVVSKMGDKECDYEATIKWAQKVRFGQLSNAFNKTVIRRAV